MVDLNSYRFEVDKGQPSAIAAFGDEVGGKKLQEVFGIFWDESTPVDKRIIKVMAVDYSISLLGEIQSLASVGLALNLAYIGLEKFRYRSRIGKDVLGQIVELNGDCEEFKETTWYKAIERLAGLSVSDESQQSMLSKSDAKMPKEVWCIVYTCVFESHIDRWIAALSCFLMFSFVFLGVSHDVSPFSGVSLGFDVTTWFSAENIGIPINISVFVSVVPVFL